MGWGGVNSERRRAQGDLFIPTRPPKSYCNTMTEQQPPGVGTGLDTEKTTKGISPRIDTDTAPENNACELTREEIFLRSPFPHILFFTTHCSYIPSRMQRIASYAPWALTLLLLAANQHSVVIAFKAPGSEHRPKHRHEAERRCLKTTPRRVDRRRRLTMSA